MDWTSVLAGTKEVSAAVLTFLTSACAILAGMYMVYSGLSKMLAYSRNERQGQPTAGPVAINLFVAAMMIQLASTVEMLVQTIFASDREDPSAVMAYLPAVKESEMLTQMVEAGLIWVSLIGFIAIFRGLLLLNDLSNWRNAEPKAGWKAFWHLIFGGLAVNVPGFIKWFA